MKEKYDEGFYKFAFEDFDRIDMNEPIKYFGDFKQVIKENDDGKEVKVPEMKVVQHKLQEIVEP